MNNEFVAISAWPVLEAECVLRGYSGICPEAIKEIMDANASGYADKKLRFEVNDFMNGMRKLLAPK